MTQLFGDRAVIGNATGCSSIYGGNLPTTPYCIDSNGRGPSWSNSLFEDNAEFGLGMRLAVDKQNQYACELLQRLSSVAGDELVQALLHADQSTETGIAEQRERQCGRERPPVSDGHGVLEGTHSAASSQTAVSRRRAGN